MLTDYFPLDLAKVISKAITIKPKIVINDDYLTTLASDGVVTIIELEHDKVVAKFNNIHNIFDGCNILEQPVFKVFLLHNNGTLLGVTSLRYDLVKSVGSPDKNIIDMVPGIIDIYVDASGKVKFDLTGNMHEISVNYPEKIVSVTKFASELVREAASDTDTLYILSVTGQLRIYTTTNHWAEFDNEIESTSIIAKGLDPNMVLTDVLRVIAQRDHLFIRKLGESHHFIDVAVNDETKLRVLDNGKVLSGVDDIVLPYLPDIVSAACGENISALLQANGRVLVMGRADYTSIPRLRLINDDNINTRANARLQ